MEEEYVSNSRFAGNFPSRSKFGPSIYFDADVILKIEDKEFRFETTFEVQETDRNPKGIEHNHHCKNREFEINIWIFKGNGRFSYFVLKNRTKNSFLSTCGWWEDNTHCFCLGSSVTGIFGEYMDGRFFVVKKQGVLI